MRYPPTPILDAPQGHRFTCRSCGRTWERMLRRGARPRGRRPMLCPTCRQIRRYLGQLERLVNELRSGEEHRAPELRARIIRVANRILHGQGRNAKGQYT